MLVLALSACLDRYLDAPYVLVAGLGRARSLAMAADGTLVAATDLGVVTIDGNGNVTPIAAATVDAVTTLPAGLITLRSGHIVGPGFEAGVPGAVDVIAGPDGAIYALTTEALWRLPRQGEVRLDAELILGGLMRARALAMGSAGDILVVTDSSIRTSAGNVLIDGLHDVRGAVVDAKARTYVVCGADDDTGGTLFRLDTAPDTGTPHLTTIARYLGDARDIAFGAGGLLPTENLYIADSAGNVTYVRPP